ncbi:MAG: SDR family oxidoreductase [Anaerolineae bacterium]|nr:SDR family oxidoreductase [Anaerolineae bacterium]
MPRPLHEQVVVVTGASSGIGRATALQLGRAGASVVLASRNRMALEEVDREIRTSGGKSLVVVTDVSQWEQVQNLAQKTVNTFGRIDTWINNAAVSMYATVEQNSIEELNRLVQVNLLGVMYGVKAALPYMIQQKQGTLINVSSALGNRAIPLQVAYSATKHGVKGFIEGLRLELKRDHPYIQAVTIFPASINTPFFSHARSKMGVKPMPFPPAYAPQLAAETIVHAVQNPQRDLYIGGASMLFTLLQRLSPMLVDNLLLTGNVGFELQKTNEPYHGPDNLFEPLNVPGRVEGDFQKLTKPSLYTRFFELTPGWQRGLSLITGIVLLLTARRISRS